MGNPTPDLDALEEKIRRMTPGKRRAAQQPGHHPPRYAVLAATLIGERYVARVEGADYRNDADALAALDQATCLWLVRMARKGMALREAAGLVGVFHGHYCPAAGRVGAGDACTCGMAKLREALAAFDADPTEPADG